MDGLDDTGTARWLSEIRDPRIEGMDGDVSSLCRYTRCGLYVDCKAI